MTGTSLSGERSREGKRVTEFLNVLVERINAEARGAATSSISYAALILSLYTADRWSVEEEEEEVETLELTTGLGCIDAEFLCHILAGWKGQRAL